MGSNDSKRILVADDTLHMRIMLQDVLTEAGYEVVTAADGEEAWKLIESEGDSIDLLILDLLMPRMTGFEILERVRESKDLPPKRSLVITGIFKSNKEVQRLKDLGANGYITKGALVDEILFRVNQTFHLGLQNTRKYPRLVLSVPVDYRVEDNAYSNYSSNISAGGVFIRTIEPALPDEKVRLKFRIPELNLDLKLSGRVVWNNEYETGRKKSSLPGMGIEFIDLPEEARKTMKSFVKEKLSQEPLWLD